MTQELISTKDEHEQNKRSNYISCALMLGSCVLWVSSYLYVNQHNLNPIQTSMIRGLVITLLTYGIMRYNGIKLDLKTNFREVTIRNIIFLLQAFGMAFVQFYLPLFIVHTIGSTGPMYVCIYQYFLDGKKINLKQLIGMIFAVIGIILTTNGRLLSHLINPDEKFQSEFENYRQTSGSSVAFYSVIFLLFMVLWGYGVYITSKIKVSPHMVNFLFGLELYMISCILYPLLIKQTKKVEPSVFYWGIPFSGILFGLAQILFVGGIVTSTNIGMTIMIGTFTIVVAYFISVIHYQEHINLFCLTGAILLIAGLSRIMLSV